MQITDRHGLPSEAAQTEGGGHVGWSPEEWA